MKRLILISMLATTSSIQFQAQDIIVLQNNEEINCDIIYEKPSYYKIKKIQGDMQARYGSKAKINRDEVRNIIDNGDHIIIKKFGKIKIWLEQEGKSITKPFCSANKKSISVINSEYRSDSRRKQYEIKNFPIYNIERIKWKKTNVSNGTIIGGSIGLVAGGVTTIFFATYLAEIPIGAAAGMAAGAILGTIVGAICQKSEKILINGDIHAWEQEKSKLPPSGFRAHDD